MQAEQGKRAIFEIIGEIIKLDGHFAKCFDNLLVLFLDKHKYYETEMQILGF